MKTIAQNAGVEGAVIVGKVLDLEDFNQVGRLWREGLQPLDTKLGDM